MLSLWHAMDELMRSDDWFRSGAGRGDTIFNPAVDIVEEEGAYLLHAELPGLRIEDVDVEITGNVLSISGKREFEDKREHAGYSRIERRYGSFCRTFTLPETVNTENVQAEMKDGVLTVRVPKSEKVRARRVKIGERALSGEPRQPTLSASTEKEKVEENRETFDQTRAAHLS